jgi:hypothetical protein
MDVFADYDTGVAETVVFRLPDHLAVHSGQAERFVAVAEVGVKNPAVPAHGQQYGGPWKIQIFGEICLFAGDLMEANAPLAA